MRYFIVTKDSKDLVGTAVRVQFLVNDWAGEGGNHFYRESIIPETNGLTALEFVAQKILKPGGDPNFECNDLDLAFEFVTGGLPRDLLAAIKLCVLQELKKALAHSPEGGQPVKSVTVIDLKNTPMRESTLPPAVVDPQLGRLS